MTLLLVNASSQVVDSVILTVTVAIEILVGVIHNDGFPVFLHQGAFFFRLGGVACGIGIQRLLESGRILEGKAFL